MCKSDLDKLAEAYARGEMPEDSQWAQVETCGLVLWFKDMPNPEFYTGNNYLVTDLINHYHELTGKPDSWINDWARFRAQDKDGHWYEYENKPEMTGTYWDDTTGEREWICQGELVVDWRNTLEEREEMNWNGENINEEQPEWKDGLPPVGECEKLFTQGWKVIEILYISKHCLVYKHKGEERCNSYSSTWKFRPIPSERERVIEAMVEVMLGKGLSYREICTALYDTFDIKEKG